MNYLLYMHYHHYVIDEGPEVGYHLKRIKGVYLLGRCEDRVEALRRRMVLITRFDFDPADPHSP